MSLLRTMIPAVLAVAALGAVGPNSPLAAPPWSAEPRPALGTMPKLDAATTWINSSPLSPAQLRGRVVLVQFWTYTCINWSRTMPYVREWSKKYEDDGLVVIGVHTPEFSFEHDLTNVRRAAKELRVEYPIAVDNDFGIWRAFDNQSWPALYLIDAQGRIRHRQEGEGGYEASERMIQGLLAETGRTNVPGDLVAPVARGAEVPADWNSLRAPETYLGTERTQRFASPGGIRPGRPTQYAAPARLHENEWALQGRWTMAPEASVLDESGGSVSYRLHARDVHLVMGSLAPAGSRFRVLIDGKPPGAAHGTDIDAAGNGRVTTQRLYQLIRQPAVEGDRTVEIQFLDAGAALYSFTFG